MEVEKLLHVGVFWQLLADEAKSTGERRADADQALKGLDGHAVQLRKG